MGFAAKPVVFKPMIQSTAVAQDEAANVSDLAAGMSVGLIDADTDTQTPVQPHMNSAAQSYGQGN